MTKKKLNWKEILENPESYEEIAEMLKKADKIGGHLKNGGILINI